MRISIHLIARDINFKDLNAFIELNAPGLTRYTDQYKWNQYLQSFNVIQ